MKNLTPTIIAAFVSVILFTATDASAQSCSKTEKATCVKNEQSLGAINAEILALEKELASIETVAKTNNVDLGSKWNYMILNKTANVAVVEDKSTAKN